MIRPSWPTALATVMRLPRYARLTAELVRDPAVPTRSKAALAAGLAYVALPIDLVPGLIPVLGQLDDLGALLLGIRFALRGLPPEVARAHLARAGLTVDQVDRDLDVTRRMLAWAAGRVARGSVRLVGRVAATGIRASRRLLRSRAP